jgi:4'-phosphopantetheinyl transferase
MNHIDPRWGRLSGRYVLPEDEVHVWRTTLNIPAADLAGLWYLLSSDERERADRFHFEVDRRRCIIGRGLLRLLLGHILSTPAKELQFEYNEFGKPRIAGRGLPIQFNLSHSGELVLIAMSLGRAVGIDVEMIRTNLDMDELAARFFSDAECKNMASLPASTQCKAFFACWTRKEAYLKAQAVGLSLPLHQFDVSVLPDEEARLLETRPDPAEARRWTLRGLEPGCDYAAALAVAGSGWKLKCWDWPRIDVVDAIDNDGDS